VCCYLKKIQKENADVKNPNLNTMQKKEKIKKYKNKYFSFVS